MRSFPGAVRKRLAGLRDRVKGRIDRLREERIVQRCEADLRTMPARTLAVLLPFPGHLKFVADTLAEVRAKGVTLHCFTDEAFILELRRSLGTDHVYPYRLCPRLRYRVILTPATHIPFKKYKNPGSVVVHLPHSMVSLHTIFPADTFLGFDHVLCCGPHHVREITAIFKHSGQRGQAWETGYEVIDRLGREVGGRSGHRRPCILIAPTWGPSSLLYRFGRDLVDRLTPHYDVILRPHKWKMEEIAGMLDDLRRDHTGNQGFAIDLDADPKPSMEAADLMISDHSGAAFEFALGCLRPVVFIDGPRKNAHINWREVLDEEGIEVIGRTRIGTVVKDLDEAENTIRSLLADPGSAEQKGRKAREEILFNYGRCAPVAAERLLEILGTPPANATHGGGTARYI
ncbi:MAG: CDP-glycerol glycerophosphotransferase family protein [Bacteroidetes bacterium]|nr:CDP-glycerol glycerophosphotransferase family protein [Bacteroidota bacterium]HMU13462.1 CDP-glycerol glycerophosphotransferase family protein [Flavobacteriales bacterium]HNA33441.1 CDP-glycerol glycerophosphotransferase family protein [Flavobacteriales bacterium]HNE80940.1 CDP-glycerol glycerophosphotransferase family protein [Flavobacteriales bacterium]